MLQEKNFTTSFPDSEFALKAPGALGSGTSVTSYLKYVSLQKKKIIIIIKQNTKTEIEECGLNAVCNPPTTAEAALLLPLDFSSTESGGEEKKHDGEDRRKKEQK